MNSMSKVALLGRPNVGKSTLFNRIIRARHAVVADQAGTTRDRLERVVQFEGRSFVLVDMAGLELTLTERNEITTGMQKQIERGLSDAALIVWVVDASTGLTPMDEHVAELLRRQHKPVVVAVNKADNDKLSLVQYDFAQFGFETTIPVSAIHDRGVRDLLVQISANLPEPVEGEVQEVEDERELRITIAGRPNVGKSTLLNAITSDERALVSPIAGTTRDVVDAVLSAKDFFGNTFTKFETVRIVDTAGIRRRGKIDREIEGWSVLRSFDAVEAAQVVLFLIDADENLVHQDLQVAERIVDAGRPLVFVVNKWDEVLTKKKAIAGTPEDEAEQEKFLNQLRYQVPFLHWVQVIFLSAKKGTNVGVLGKVILNSYIAWSTKVDQNELNELTAELRKMPRLKNLKKITYEHSQPPVFHMHMHGNFIPHFSTRRYVENALRDFFNIGPTPIKIWVETQNARKASSERA